MAFVFYNAIMKAFAEKRLVNPGKIADTGTVGCEKEYGTGIYAGGLTQTGSGEDDGIYKHASEYAGILFSITSEWDRNQWRFARLWSRNRDDLIGWYEKEEGVHWYGVWKNNGGGKFEKTAVDLNPVIYCIPRGVRWIDMNGKPCAISLNASDADEMANSGWT